MPSLRSINKLAKVASVAASVAGVAVYALSFVFPEQGLIISSVGTGTVAVLGGAIAAVAIISRQSEPLAAPEASSVQVSPSLRALVTQSEGELKGLAFLETGAVAGMEVIYLGIKGYLNGNLIGVLSSASVVLMAVGTIVLKQKDVVHTKHALTTELETIETPAPLLATPIIVIEEPVPEMCYRDPCLPTPQELAEARSRALDAEFDIHPIEEVPAPCLLLKS